MNEEAERVGQSVTGFPVDRRREPGFRGLDAERAWSLLLGIRDHTRRFGAAEGELSVVERTDGGALQVLPGHTRHALLRSHADGSWETPFPCDRSAALLLDLYLPLCRAARAPDRPYVVAHLGQSLDGRIATVSGVSQWVTGPADLTHTHRMRALADAVLVGAGTVRHDNPRLTVRRVEGRNPLRVVIDAERRLSSDATLFRDGAADTLVVCTEQAAARSGDCTAELLPLPAENGVLSPATVCAALGRRGVRLLFVEGGGVTVSRFLQAGCVDRLQLTVAPLLLGSGRPAISLPEVADLTRVLRPRVRHIPLGVDVMFDCVFDG